MMTNGPPKAVMDYEETDQETVNRVQIQYRKNPTQDGESDI
jgi:hypothetical protein